MSLMELVESLCLSFRWRGHMLSTQSIRSTYTQQHKTKRWKERILSVQMHLISNYYELLKCFCFQGICTKLIKRHKRDPFMKCVDVPWSVSWPGSPAWCDWTPGWWHYTASLSETAGSRSNVSTGPWTSLSPSECWHPSHLSYVCYLVSHSRRNSWHDS